MLFGCLLLLLLLLLLGIIIIIIILMPLGVKIPGLKTKFKN